MVMVACHKHDDNDTVVPSITLTTPSNAQVFVSGDSIKFTGNVSDNSLHNLRLSITTVGGTLLYEKEISVHDLTSYAFNEGWKSSVAAVTNAVAKAEVEDHGGHVAEQKVDIRINP
jgi:hypothetical protein